MNQYDNTILISGGTRGIGYAIAQKFAKEGQTVIITDRDRPGELGANIHFKEADVRKRGDVEELYRWVLGKFGPPKTLVLNAGRGIQEKLTEGDPEGWKEIMDTNLMGALYFIRLFVPEMLEQKRGNVIFVSSVAAGRGFPYGGIYAASKTALDVIAETLRLETLPLIKVTTICPGITDTDFFSNTLGGHTSIQEMGMGAISPEEIADDVHYCTTKRHSTGINKIITRPIGQSF